MPLLLQHKETHYRWGIWRVDESLKDLAALHPWGDRYLEEVNKLFSNDKRRVERLASRVLLYHLLGEPKEVTYLPSGKPVLEDGSYALTISHSSKYVAVMLSSAEECGIDLEQYGLRVLRIKERFIHRSEGACQISEEVERWATLNDLSIEALDDLLHWSGKETLYKMLNRSDVDFREHLRIAPFVLQKSGMMEAVVFPSDTHAEIASAEAPVESAKVLESHFLLHYEIFKEFVLTWSVKE